MTAPTPRSAEAVARCICCTRTLYGVKAERDGYCHACGGDIGTIGRCVLCQCRLIAAELR